MPGFGFGFGIRRAAIAARRAPFDPLASSLYAVFGLKRLVSTWTGPLVTVRRDSDNATTTVFPDVSGRASLSSMTGAGQPLGTWVGSASAHVTQWWDQTGNGRHALQTTAFAQPRLVNAGVLHVTGTGAPVLSFDGTAQHFVLSGIFDFDRGRSAVTLAAAFARTGGAATGQFLVHTKTASVSTRAGLALEYSGGSYLGTIGGRHPDGSSYAYISAGTNGTGTWTRLAGRLRAGDGMADIMMNGALTTGAHLTAAAFSDADGGAAVSIGATGSWGNFFPGSLAAVVLAQSALELAAVDRALSEVLA